MTPDERTTKLCSKGTTKSLHIKVSKVNLSKSRQIEGGPKVAKGTSTEALKMFES